MKQTFSAKEESVLEFVNYIGNNMEAKGFNKNLVYEYRLLVEEIALKLIHSAKPDAKIHLEMKRRFNSYSLLISCCGDMVALESEDEFDFGGLIIEEYSDYLIQSYSEGVNQIKLSFSTSSNQTLLLSIIALILSAIVAFPILLSCNQQQSQWLNTSIIYPIVSFFIKCLQTLSMPTTFFSLACLIVNLKTSLSGEIRLRRYFIRCFGVSLCAILIGTAFWFLYNHFGVIISFSGYITNSKNIFGNSVEDFLMKLISCNIIEPFVLDNPIPLLIIAVLMGFGIANVFGEEGELARKTVRCINSVFTSMLNIIYGLVPVFLFFALLSNWLVFGPKFLGAIVLLFTQILPMFLIMFIIYMIQLKISGISPIGFCCEFKDVIWNNLKIGSNIEAVPYNKRMLFRKKKIKRSILKKELKLGSMVNMDGNCIMLSFGILYLLSAVGIEMSFQQIIAIFMIIILLGIGIPNQPGSFLLGMIVLMTYFGISDLLYINVLIVEAFMNKLYSFMNALGDVVAVLSNDNVTNRVDGVDSE